MSDTPPKAAEKPNIQAAVLPQIDEERAKELACEWIESNNLPQRKQSYRIGTVSYTHLTLPTMAVV